MDKLKYMQGEFDELTLRIESEESSSARKALRKVRNFLSAKMVVMQGKALKNGLDVPNLRLGPKEGKRNPDYLDDGGGEDE